jgi:choline monooxygenase
MTLDLFGDISNDYYYRSDIEKIELTNIFKKSWLCVGFTDDLHNHNDFITSQIGPHSIVVQNFRGKLRAFRNVCTHRFSRIQCDKKGNRQLMCPYHGWTFNSEGVPIGVPFNKQSFNLDETAKKNLALESYNIELCGRFVFVKMDKSGITLRDFLGKYYDALLHLTEICTDRFETASFEWNANWKMGMDNAAEGYHVPLVHSNSFALVLSLDLKIETECEHSLYTGNLTDRSLKWWNSVAKNINLIPSKIYPQYANFLIFPNIVITFSFGSLLTFQTLEPINSEKLRINSTAWLASNKSGAARDMVVESLTLFSETVRNEDKEICEIAQQGLQDLPVTRPPLLGSMEGRIKHFQRSYAKRMEQFFE